jgi:tight adherence protein B
MPGDPHTALAALLCGAVAAGVLLVAAGLRGVRVNSARPPGRASRAALALRSPALRLRLVGGVLAAAATLVMTRWPVAAAGLGALILAWPALFGGARAEQAQITRLEALVTWTESLRDTIAGQASLERAIPASTEHAPPAIRPALVRLAGQIQVRAPLPGALMSLAGDLNDPSADFVISALILNVSRRGDRLAQVLGHLALAAREEVDMRRRVLAGRAGLRRGVQIMMAMTIGFAAYLSIFSRDYVRPYATPTGQVALAVVTAFFAVGFGWMRRLSAGRATAPFLARPGLDITEADLQVVSTLTGLTAQDALNLSVTGGPRRLGTVGGPR